MVESIEIGTISARGQVAIPSEIRERMHLNEGEKVLFVLEGENLLVKKVSSLSWEEITKPLREAAKKSGLKESDVPRIIHEVRKQKK
ncbi:AbrB/MazE/SpoVT family DNA-binding domain-containing protein [Candidatus Woesearchaeota archaeon]|nr:AbrB/MazE/SpoVT family DNA-binding domain-containing protein [Candidatus Woesearchaeota archaeon]